MSRVHGKSTAASFTRLFLMFLAALLVAVTASSEAMAGMKRPLAKNDRYTVKEDNVLRVAKHGGVLKNDRGGRLFAKLVKRPKNGAFRITRSGGFIFDSKKNWNGKTAFRYKACHVKKPRLCSQTKRAVIKVRAVNDTPIAKPDSFWTKEDTRLTIQAPGVLRNDSDIENSRLKLASISNAPNYGKIISHSESGQLVYQPNKDFSGVDYFGYKITDGGKVAYGTVKVTVTPVNDAPVASDDRYFVNEDNTLRLDSKSVLGNDRDADGDPLKVVNAKAITGPSNGTLSLDSNGNLRYTPRANWYGTDVFTYKATDGKVSSNVATVRIVVSPVNDAPVAKGDVYQIKNTQKLIKSAPGVLRNDFDIDSPKSSLRIVDHGHMSGAKRFNVRSDGKLVYVPRAGFTGIVKGIYIVSDGNAKSRGVITIRVTK